MAHGPVRLGFTLGEYPQPSAPGRTLFDTVAEQTVAAERAGFDSVWVPDHLMQTPTVGRRDEPMLECYTTLGALAALTSRVRLGSLVGCAGYRTAGLLAKALMTLDCISDGRAVFGIGAGWFEGEHDAFGYEFGSVSDRFERMVEVIEIVRSMSVHEQTDIEGRHMRAVGAISAPRSVQPAGPPVLIGGSGERRTLRLVAEHADICNLTGGPERLRHLLSVLHAHCESVGRDPASICRTFINIVIVRDTEAEAIAAIPPSYRKPSEEHAGKLAASVAPIAGTRSQVAEQLAELAATGIDGMIMSCCGPDRNGDYVEMLAELGREAFPA